jgi:hypothetical protein
MFRLSTFDYCIFQFRYFAVAEIFTLLATEPFACRCTGVNGALIMSESLNGVQPRRARGGVASRDQADQD